jgi:hypothetical protein
MVSNNLMEGTGNCKVLLDQANKMKGTWKAQPQPYKKKCFNANYNKRTSFQKNSGEHDNKKQDFYSTQDIQSQIEKGVEKRFKQQLDQFMAYVAKTDSLPKDNTLDLKNFSVYFEESNNTKNLNRRHSTYTIVLMTV